MQATALFRSCAPEAREEVTLEWEGEPLRVPAGTTVAAALLGAGVRTFRSTTVSDSPRAPYCMMGVCFECLLEIDGEPNRQSCRTEVAEGMRIRMQRGARGIEEGGA